MLKIEYVDVAKLKPYDKNTRKHEDYDVSQIAHSIEEYGFNDPIGIWGKDNIYEIAAEYGVGAETGNRKGKVVPQKYWIDKLVRLADEWKIPIFMKESLRQLMGDGFRQDKLLWMR